MNKTHVRNAGVAAGILAAAEIRHRQAEPVPPEDKERFGFLGIPPGGVWPAEGATNPLSEDVLADEE